MWKRFEAPTCRVFWLFSTKQTKENYPQFTKPEALVVLQQHFMFHRMHHRMCS